MYMKMLLGYVAGMLISYVAGMLFGYIKISCTTWLVAWPPGYTSLIDSPAGVSRQGIRFPELLARLLMPWRLTRMLYWHGIKLYISSHFSKSMLVLACQRWPFSSPACWWKFARRWLDVAPSLPALDLGRLAGPLLAAGTEPRLRSLSENVQKGVVGGSPVSDQSWTWVIKLS